uniref:A-kinase anchor 110kDa C-terminal domain-containing protein n=1 Tax=Chelonoidis abingdonii TaxID=106734 RepID=A0A8C0IQK1_CHEAB
MMQSPTCMSQEVDWLHSQAGVCKVDLYNPDEQKDQDRKVICFVDVSSLNVKDKDSKAKKAASQSSSISEPSNELDLGNLEEKEVIVIKDNEKHDHSKTEGAVCLFKQGSTDELSIVSWLNNDLQKYAVGFQHALTPSDAPQKCKVSETFNDPSLSQNSDTSLKSAGAQKGKRDPDDVSYYVNKLCSLVVQMARKEITEKLEGTASKFIRQGIHGSAGEGKNNSRGSVSKIASQMVNEAVEKEDTSGSKRTSLFYGEMSNQNGCKQGGKPGDKQMCQQTKQSGQDDSGTSVSKGLMVYANQVASDMMFSFMKTMKVQRKDGKTTPACVVLKKVILKHTKDVISDLIDSTMKNLHNVTGVLMTDSDFVSTVKKNLFNLGSQKSTEILEAMVKRLFKALAGDDKQSRSQSLAYTSLKTGSQDSKSQGMQFTAMKSEMHNQGKDKDRGASKYQASSSKDSEKHCSMDKYAKDLIVTALMLIQQHLLQQTNGKDSARESGATSFGYLSCDSHFEKAGSSQSSKSLSTATGSRHSGAKKDHQQLDSQKGDISSILLSIIQKVLREAGFNIDDNSSETHRNYRDPATTDSKSSKKSLSKQPNSAMDQFDNMDQVNKQFIDQLVESVMKLCLFMAKNNSPDLAMGDLLDEQNTFGATSSKTPAVPRRTSQSKGNGKQLSGSSSGSEVIVNNQNSNSSLLNKELQAILQWMAASHFNVPNLSFMNENEGDLKKLPLLAEKAAKKGYSVGDILQEVMSKAPEKVRGSQEKKPEKVSTAIESLAKDLTVTALMLIQQHLIQKTNRGRDSITHDSGTSSLGFVSCESHFEKAGKSQSSKSLAMTGGSRNIPQEGDISSILLSIIQKVLREAGFNIDDNSSETDQSFKQVATTDSESSKKSLSTQPNSAIDQFDNMDQVNKKFLDQLVESVMNLCLFMTKCNNSDLAIGDPSDEQNVTGASFSGNKSTALDKEGSREASQVRSSGKQLSELSSGSEVIVNNQNANNSTQNKELQAILQWMAASHFNVPNLSFMNEEEGNLKKLPLLAEKAAKKGCSVGDIIQEVMRYFEKQQIDAAVGNVSRYGLMDWLLANL